MRTLADAAEFRDEHGAIRWLEYTQANGIDGFLHPSELNRLVELATDKDVLEIGSFKGLSAWGMAHTAKHIICVDTFEADSAGQSQTGQFTTLAIFDRNLEGFKNVARVPMTSEKAAELIPGSFDMIFIDAMHTYEEVKTDINRWWPRVRQGGVMCLHDYGHDAFTGVKQAADEVFGETTPAFVTVTLREVWKYGK